MGEHAGRTDDQDRLTERVALAFAAQNVLARGESELHRIGKADHHDERRHHVEEHIEPEAEPAQRAEREHDGNQRRAGGDHHERDAPEEYDGDEASDGETERVINEPVALHGVAQLELDHRDAGQSRLQPRAGEVVVDDLADFADHGGQGVAADRRRLERENHQRQLAVGGQQLALDDLVRSDALDQLLVGGALRQFLGKQRRRQMAGLRRLARREQRNQPAHAVDQLQIGDGVAQLGEFVAPQQVAAGDRDQDVELARGETARHVFVGVELRRVGPEQLAQRVVDPDARDAEGGGNRENQQNGGYQEGVAQRNQPDALDSECKLVAFSVGLHPTLPQLRRPLQLILNPTIGKQI